MVGILIEIYQSNLLQASAYWYMREQQRGTVSSNYVFEAVPFQQYSADLSSIL